MLKSEPILVSKCHEKDGDVIRSIYPLMLDKETLFQIWDKTRQFKTVFNTEIKEDFNKFLSVFANLENNMISANGLFWSIDDLIGIYYLTDIYNTEATVHFTFFDKRFNGRLDMTKLMLAFVFDKYKFQRLNVEIPAYASASTQAFVKALGFQMEGKKRSAILFDGRWFDTKLFGLLKSEILTGD